MKNKKQLILKFLLDKGLSSTGAIASFIKANQYQTENYLLQLKAEAKVKNTSVPNAEYWELKYKKLPTNQTSKQIKEKLK